MERIKKIVRAVLHKKPHILQGWEYVTIKDGLFFKEDFEKLPKGIIVYIRERQIDVMS